ncbi:MAG: ABC transporter substrate-binding protein [Candidatus Tectomicrobia bacterium]|uniref:ABC transporter substrate-binding protein n=1 Tax=Tectimicrobiota bacterium TaxID=2528274 RepID=A0A932I2B5_UNCTE|nr:ABC transporter substrate-binding protein [Candidatus Tectomicrobia bacterium]
MGKKTAVFFMILALLAPVPLAAAQQPAGKVWRIGILTSAWVPWHSQTNGFREGLSQLGYVEGRNVVFEALAAKGDSAVLPALAEELIRKKPDLLFCGAAPEALACQRATRTIPIVFTQTGDPVKLGLVESLARPGGNITGIGSLRGMLTAKRLELFKEIAPSLKRVLVTYDPREHEEKEAVEFARRAAARLGLTLIERPIADPLEIEPGLAELRKGGEEGILIVQANPNLNIPGRSLEVATSNAIPTMYPSSFWTQYGALASYGADQYEQGKQAARLAHKVLTGTLPQDIPVELPRDIKFVVNLKTAKRIGLTVPPEVLFRADRVIR